MDKYAQLEKLDELRGKWILSPNEFEVEKKRILDSMQVWIKPRSDKLKTFLMLFFWPLTKKEHQRMAWYPLIALFSLSLVFSAVVSWVWLIEQYTGSDILITTANNFNSKNLIAFDLVSPYQNQSFAWYIGQQLSFLRYFTIMFFLWISVRRWQTINGKWWCAIIPIYGIVMPFFLSDR